MFEEIINKLNQLQHRAKSMVCDSIQKKLVKDLIKILLPETDIQSIKIFTLDKLPTYFIQIQKPTFQQFVPTFIKSAAIFNPRKLLLKIKNHLKQRFESDFDFHPFLVYNKKLRSKIKVFCVTEDNLSIELMLKSEVTDFALLYYDLLTNRYLIGLNWKSYLRFIKKYRDWHDVNIRHNQGN